VIETADDLVRARQAHEAHDWSTAAARFDAVGAERLTADDLTAYADALWWLGRVEDNLRVEAAAHDALLADSRTAGCGSSSPPWRTSSPGTSPTPRSRGCREPATSLPCSTRSRFRTS
jgi:hypothetical protein